jgi:hypothetical protein
MHRLFLAIAAWAVSATLAAAAGPPLDAAALAGRIDALIGAPLTAAGVPPAPRADDAEFLRRAYLDLAGRVPRTAEARAFLADPAADKRARLIEHLLETAFYPSHLARAWREQILPDDNNPQLRFAVGNFEGWLRQQFRDRVRFDRLVRELLTAPVSAVGRGPGAAVNPFGSPLLAYYQVNEFKPENLAARTSRAFLGVNLECAQCHNHPFGSWTRQQFWQFAAFFAGIQPQAPNQAFTAGPDRPELREITIPETKTTVQARFLDGTEPRFQTGTTTRQTLAEWLTSPANPYFARNLANRLWAHMFGIGLVDPVDEFTDENPPSHPELLDELAAQLVAHDFDLAYLLRAMALSETYQRQSAQTDPGQDEPRLFAKMAVKGLTAEQLFDSLAVATGYREPPTAPGVRFAGLNANTPRAEFLAKFASTDRKTEPQTSILQALALMNGRFIGDVTSLDRSETLAAVLDAPFLDDAGRIETLFLAALTRPPTEAEARRLLAYVRSGGPKSDPRAALADVFWALLNSSEFILNH